MTPAEQPQRASIRRNAFDLLTSQLITWVLAVAVTVVQPRFLGPEGQGQLRLAYSMWVVAEVTLSLGTSTFLTLQMSKDTDRGWSLVRPILRLRLLGSLVAWVVLASYVAATDGDVEFMVVLVLIGIVTNGQTVSNVFNAALNGMEQMRFPAVAYVVARIVGVVLTITVLLAGAGLVGVAAVAVVATGVNLGLLWRHVLPHLKAAPPAGIALRTLVRASAGFVVADVSLIAYQQVDTIVIASVASEETLGYYGAADQLFSTMLFVPTIVMTSLFPVLGRLHEFDPDKARAIVRRVFVSMLLVSCPTGVGIFLTGRTVAPLVFGDDFEDAGPVLMVFGLVLILVSNTILLGRYAIATGRQRFWNTLMIGVTLLTIPLDLVLVPWASTSFGNGAIGGALAYVVTESLLVVAGVGLVGRSLLRDGALSRIIRTGLATAVMAAAVWPVRDAMILIPIAVGVVAYLAAVLATGALGPEDRALIRSVADRVRSR